MKKITFLLFAFVSTSFFAQDQLTSSLDEYYDEISAAWSQTSKTDYAYDDNKNLVDATDFYWDSSNSTWIKSSKSSYTYNDNNKVTVENYVQYDGNRITSQYRTITYYNSDGNLNKINYWNYNLGVWFEESVIDITYVDGKISYAIGSEWDQTQSQYFYGDDSFYITFAYNTNGKLSSSKSDSWDGTKWVDLDKTLFTYDANNRMTLEDSQTWDGANWVTAYKTEYTYDANGNVITQKDYYLDDNVLVEGDLETISYDTSKLMSNYSHPFRDKTGIDYIFSIDGIVNKILSRSSVDYRTTYTYGEATANTNNFSVGNFAIYPNPTTAILNIDDRNFSLKNVEVYNILGKKVLTSSSKKINVEHLVHGVYVLKVQDDKGNIATKRFVKN